MHSPFQRIVTDEDYMRMTHSFLLASIKVKIDSTLFVTDLLKMFFSNALFALLTINR